MSDRAEQAEPPRLGALEAQVMEVLWDHSPATVRQVIEYLPSDPAYTTIATVLTNLHRKQLLTVTRQRRSTRYAPKISRQEYAATLMGHALDASRDRAGSMLHFVETMAESDLDVLRGYLARRDEGQEER